METPKINIDASRSQQTQVNGVADNYLVTSLEYLRAYINKRLAIHLHKEVPDVGNLPRPGNENDSFAKFVRHYNPSDVEMIVLLTAIAPHIIPGFFDSTIRQYLSKGGEFSEFGGVKGKHHRGTLPTGETVLFILAGTDMKERLKYLGVFDDQQLLFQHNVLSLETVKNGEPALSGRLLLDPDYAEVFTTGNVSLPKLSINFPARHITTEYAWDDLVLEERVKRQVMELQSWIRHHNTLMYEWGMEKKLKPGYRALFYGPPGTGKTLTATLLGKYTGRDVFRIDLSMIVSKYIGETEKNLATLFDKAEHKDWILFFDEADAIFGKRTGVRDAHDKYANQEVSYLLQRVEMHPGLIILASNFKGNIDEAFLRRFNSIIYFPKPDKEERRDLWEKAFPKTVTLEDDNDLDEIAASYELTGSHIINVVQYLCLEALSKGTSCLSRQDIVKGIRRELEKEGR